MVPADRWPPATFPETRQIRPTRSWSLWRLVVIISWGWILLLPIAYVFGTAYEAIGCTASFGTGGAQCSIPVIGPLLKVSMDLLMLYLIIALFLAPFTTLPAGVIVMIHLGLKLRKRWKRQRKAAPGGEKGHTSL